MIEPVKWLGTGSGIIGAALMAANVEESGWAFAFFLVSSMAWCWVGLRTRDKALTALQAVFVCIDVLGVWRWLM